MLGPSGATTSARSWPAQNALPIPVMMMARTDSSMAKSSSLDWRARAISRLKLLNTAGRLSLTMATCPCFSKMSVSLISICLWAKISVFVSGEQLRWFFLFMKEIQEFMAVKL